MPDLEIDGYVVKPEEIEALPDDARVTLEFKPFKSTTYTGKGFLDIPDFNRQLDVTAEDTYLQEGKEYDEPYNDEWGVRTEKGKSTSTGSEMCGRDGNEFYLTGKELKQIAALAQQRAQMSESEEAEPCG
jgi:hypothetical protein